MENPMRLLGPPCACLPSETLAKGNLVCFYLFMSMSMDKHMYRRSQPKTRNKDTRFQPLTDRPPNYVYILAQYSTRSNKMMLPRNRKTYLTPGFGGARDPKRFLQPSIGGLRQP